MAYVYPIVEEKVLEKLCLKVKLIKTTATRGRLLQNYVNFSNVLTKLSILLQDDDVSVKILMVLPVARLRAPRTMVKVKLANNVSV